LITADSSLIAVLAVAAVLSAIGAGAVRMTMLRLGIVVQPRPDRWHRTPTPTYGGVAILGSVAAALALATPGWFDGLLPLVAVGVALFAAGWYDDLAPMSALEKMVSSLAVAAFFVFTLSGVGATPWQAALTVVAVIWFGFIDNAVNLLDNMDGLAAGVSAIAALALAVIFSRELGPAAALLVALGGALLGFLVWNRHPAKIFMGNCGSLAIGGLLAACATLAIARAGTATAAAAAVLILVVPIVDTAFVVLLRRLAGRSTTRGNIDHTSHRLVSAGFSEPKAVAVLYALGVGGALCAYLLRVNPATGGPVAVAFVVGILMFLVYLARVPAYAGQDFQALQNAPFAPLLSDLTFRWHAGEVLLDLALIATCYYAAYRIRFNGEALATFLPGFAASLPAILGCQLAALYLSGLYKRMWSTFGLHDLSTVLRGVGGGVVLSVLAVTYVYKFERFSRGVFMIDAVLLTTAIVGTRLSFRILGRAAAGNSPHMRRVAIYGAGSRGLLLARELQVNPSWGLNPVAFLDDERQLRSRRLIGVPVRGTLDDLERIVRSMSIEEVLLSSPAINGHVETRVREVCAALDVPVRRLYLDIR
jgi:UDP-GlcNAc:undecaprenyl-phosphate/decaprenyl-phosphate GlcNAc-1-phosphate transferase